ncbi:DUF2877 domain-containing protein [Thorsellia anophelis]|uniref:DUF2877 domain-containing protein n=1 Tax=Thorsellia anophelis DSM 18579 TaxID=1123402 RepID=A0A1I0CNA2_9GAMM|nr:DUF2877 domain-containing protein [Thorsellia anophelis]SET20487.1 Protein of unknown function [Thorsellia anophelis DSM 18579]
MQIMDYSAYLLLSDYEHYEQGLECKVIACFSKAIYCADVNQLDNIICFTPQWVTLGPLSIRVYQWEVLFDYMNLLMRTSQYFVLRIVKENLMIDNLELSLEKNRHRAKLINTATRIGCVDFLSLNPILFSQCGSFSEKYSAALKGFLNSDFSLVQKIYSTGLGMILPWILSTNRNLVELFFQLDKKRKSSTGYVSHLARMSSKRALSSSTLKNKGQFLLSNLGFEEQKLLFDHKTHFIKDVLTAIHLIHLGLIKNEYESISRGVKQLIGFGDGLTPSGDDFLVGLIISFKYFKHKRLHSLLKRAIVGHWKNTHKISRAFLKAAIDGFVSEPLANSLDSLYQFITIDKHNQKVTNDLIHSIKHLFTIGHSSGIDALTGLVFGVGILTQQTRCSSKI